MPYVVEIGEKYETQILRHIKIRATIAETYTASTYLITKLYRARHNYRYYKIISLKLIFCGSSQTGYIVPSKSMLRSKKKLKLVRKLKMLKCWKDAI